MTEPRDPSTSSEGFARLGLRPELLVGVARLGFTAMTDIQAAALPLALTGRDLVGHARTGSGKTAAFALPVLQALDLADRSPQALVLCPTRELAQQLTDAIRALAVGLEGTRVITVTGGAPLHVQREALRGGAHVVVGTAGRLLEHLERGFLDLGRLRCLVLDEADRMLDMGFEEQVDAILTHVPGARQTLLFSATWPAEMAALSGRVQRDPAVVGVQALVDEAVLRQRVVLCEEDQRLEALVDTLARRTPTATLIFCETKVQCQELAVELQRRGASALALHGDLEQADRDEVLVRLRNESVRIVVATNVAARGLDLDGLELVICYELSPDPDVHVHRVGRTARGEAEGEAISFVAGARELRRLDDLEDRLATTLPRSSWSGRKAASVGAWTAPYRTVRIVGGRKDKLRPGDLLGALTGDVGLVAADVGRITLTDRCTWVALRAEVAEAAARTLQEARIKNKRFRVQLVR